MQLPVGIVADGANFFCTFGACIVETRVFDRAISSKEFGRGWQLQLCIAHTGLLESRYFLELECPAVLFARAVNPANEYTVPLHVFVVPRGDRTTEQKPCFLTAADGATTHLNRPKQVSPSPPPFNIRFS